MVALVLWHRASVPVHWDQIPNDQAESYQKTDPDRRMRVHWFRAARIRFLHNKVA
jgi:hypothetical protein